MFENEIEAITQNSHILKWNGTTHLYDYPSDLATFDWKSKSKCF